MRDGFAMQPERPEEEPTSQRARIWRKVLVVALCGLGLFFTIARDASELRSYNDAVKNYVSRFLPLKIAGAFWQREAQCTFINDLSRLFTDCTTPPASESLCDQ